MDFLASPITISTSLILAGFFCFREAFTPPNAHADDAVRIKNKVNRLTPLKYNRSAAFITKNLTYIHFFLELYALWATSSSPPLNLDPAGLNSICPLSTPGSTPSALRRIHPSGSLSWQTIVGLSLVIFGGLVRASCHRALGKLFTWETSIHKDHKLITSGAYQFVRHPSYTGMVAVCMGHITLLLSPGTYIRECFIGSSNLQSNVGTFAFVYVIVLAAYYADVCVWLVRRSFVEDNMMKRQFGKEWEEWARNVRWRVFPYVL